MLERMEAMGKVVRISETSEGCLSGSCKSCPEGKAVEHGVNQRLRRPQAGAELFRLHAALQGQHIADFH
jgi:hypothetical protein